jgi:mono/diheme cytochrome c family protein
MKRLKFICAVLALLSAAPAVLQTKPLQSGAPGAAGLPAQAEQSQAVINTYCTGCHNSKSAKPAGGLALDTANVQAPTEHPEIWEKAIRKLRGRLMPPPGSRQPEQKDIDSLVGYLENTLDAHATGPKAGYVGIHRMSRTEYAAEVKALVGVDVTAKDVLPADVSVEGFDNIASALSASPAFVEQYVEAARMIAKKAVGDTSLDNVMYPLRANTGGEAMPLGLRDGGLRLKHNFTADGEYRFKVHFPDGTLGLYTGSLENAATLVVMIDGKVLFKKSIGGLDDLMLNNRKAGDGRAQIQDRFDKIPLQIQAGVREVVVGFIDRSRFESISTQGGGGGFGGGGLPSFDNIEITGPYKKTGISTVSHKLIYVCEAAERKPDAKREGGSAKPQETAQPQVTTAGEAACAKQIAGNLARRAFRRPVTDADLAKLMPFYENGRRDAQARQGEASNRDAQARQGEASNRDAQARQGEASNKEGGNFDAGIQRLVAAVLASPDFLYRTIRGVQPQGTKTAGAEVALTDNELASRLSFFIWNTGPDDELLKLAASKDLSKPAVMDAQVKRMLADPKASSLVTNFAMKWLGLNDLDALKPDQQVFAGFNDQLKKDLVTEAETFITSVLLENRPLVELLTSDQTYLNDRVARHYGLTDITGSQFRWVRLTDKNRLGLLGKGAVLMKTSYPNRTSPVLRGAWILDKIIGTPPTPPPPTVENQDLAQKPGETPKTVRARLEQHRDNATCRQCHGVIDPMGLALENFDGVGQFRTVDRQAANSPIDASSVLPSGLPINGPAELREYLASNPAKFAQAFTEKLMMYAVNRQLQYFDMPQVRAAVRNAAKDNFTLYSIVQGIVHSDAFLKQGPPSAPQANGTKVAGIQ